MFCANAASVNKAAVGIYWLIRLCVKPVSVNLIKPLPAVRAEAPRDSCHELCAKRAVCRVYMRHDDNEKNAVYKTAVGYAHRNTTIVEELSL